MSDGVAEGVKNAATNVKNSVVGAVTGVTHTMRKVVKGQNRSDPHDNASYNFFPDIGDRELEPVVVDALTTTHPDETLRRLGLIHQLGRVNGTQVYFNARYQEWRNKETDVRIPLATLREGERAIADRRDLTPSGIIRIICSENYELPHAVSAKSGAPVQTLEDQMKNEADALLAIERRAKMLKSGEPEDKKNLRGSEIKKFVMQYLSRAVPQAALATKSLIVVTPGKGCIADHVGSGVSLLQDHRTQLLEQLRLRVLGVTGYNSDVQTHKPNADLESTFTHHILLRRSRKCRNVLVLGKDLTEREHNCKGFEGKEKESEKYECRYCNQSIEDHVPSHAYRKKLKELKRQGATGADLEDRINVELEELVFNEKPNKMEVDRYCSAIVETLAFGVAPDRDIPGRIGREPPKRNLVPTCAILIGGDPHTAKHELLQCVVRRWGIVVVEGTGGYADVLCGVRNRIQEVFPANNADQYRAYTVATDPFTAEIVNSGLVQYVEKGTKSEEVVRLIEGCMKGNKALFTAWHTYALWDYNSKRQRMGFVVFQGTILALSVFTTALTVVQTFLILLWKQDDEVAPPILPDAPDHRGQTLLVVWTIMQWLVIALPIMSTLVTAMANKKNNGTKWVLLRTASERLLSEIYQYRTETLLYKSEEVTKHKSEAVKLAGGRVYQSREDLLQQKSKEFTDYLSKGETKSVTLEPYDGPIPPAHISKVDDGFKALPPERYIKVRLDARANNYWSKSKNYQKWIMMAMYSSYLLSALGTAMATVGTYANGAFHAWVALTTAMGSALTRWLDLSRLEWRHKKYNTAVSNLTNVAAWWASLGPSADSIDNRDLLVQQVEGILSDEVDTWGEQLHGSLEKMKKEASGGDGGGGKGGKGGGGGGANDAKQSKQEQAEARAMKELDLEDLTADKVLQFIKDPEGEVAKRLGGKMNELKGKLLGGATDLKEKVEAAEKMEIEKMRQEATATHRQMVQSAEVAGDAIPVLRDLKFGGLGVADFVPNELKDLVRTDGELRRKLVDNILGKSAKDTDNKKMLTTAQTVAYHSIMESAKHLEEKPYLGYPNFWSYLKQFNQRQVLEIMKYIVLEELLQPFLKGGADGPGLRTDQLLPNHDDLELFISELNSIHRVQHIKEIVDAGGLQAISELFGEAVIKQAFMDYGKHTKDVNSVVVKIVAIASNELKEKDREKAALLHRLLDNIAQLDVDELSSQTEIAAVIPEAVAQVTDLSYSYFGLARQELLRMLPPKLRNAVASKSQLQLAKYIANLVKGTPASRVFTAFNATFRHFFDSSSEIKKRLLDKKDVQTKFVTAVEQLTQKEINTGNNASLMRRMRSSPAFDAEINHIMDLFDPQDLKVYLSSVQGRFGSSYSAMLIDRGADFITSFDLRTLLNFANRDRLTEKLSDLHDIDVKDLNKVDILQRLGFKPLALACDCLTQTQLRELLSVLQTDSMVGWAMGSSFLEIMETLWFLNPEKRKGKHTDMVRRWKDIFVQRLFTVAAITNKAALDEEMAEAKREKEKKDAADKEKKEKEKDEKKDPKKEIVKSRKFKIGVADCEAWAPKFLIRSADEVILNGVTVMDKIEICEMFELAKQKSDNMEVDNVFEVVTYTTGYNNDDYHFITEVMLKQPAVRVELFELCSEFFSEEGQKTMYRPITEMRSQSKKSTEDVDKEFVTEFADKAMAMFRAAVEKKRQSMPPPAPTDDTEEEGAAPKQTTGQALLDKLVAMRARRTMAKDEYKGGEWLMMDLLFNVFHEAKFSAPLRIFHSIALCITEFDFRELFPSVEDRYRLGAALFLLFKQDAVKAGMKKFLAIDKKTLEGKIIPLKEEKTEDTAPGTMPERYKAPGDWLSEIHDEFDELDEQDRGFLNVTRALRTLSELQLRFVFENAQRIIEDTVLGRFFTKFVEYLEANKWTVPSRDGEVALLLSDKLLFQHALYGLMHFTMRHPAKVRANLCRFDAKVFKEKSTPEKKQLLSGLMEIGSDLPRELIASFDIDRTEELFLILKVAVPEDESRENKSQDSVKARQKDFLHKLFTQMHKKKDDGKKKDGQSMGVKK